MQLDASPQGGRSADRARPSPGRRPTVVVEGRRHRGGRLHRRGRVASSGRRAARSERPDSTAASATRARAAAAPGAASRPPVASAVPVGVADAGDAVVAVVPSALAASPSGATPGSPASPGAVRVSVGPRRRVRVQDRERRCPQGRECGAVPGLDGLVLPRLRKLAECPEAARTTGKVHLVVHADFPRDALAVELGHDHGARRRRLSSHAPRARSRRRPSTGSPTTTLATASPTP